MSQVLTPEEMAALLAGLREAEGGPDGERRDSSKEIVLPGRGFPERRQVSSFQNLSNWLMAMADLRWPHL